MVEGVVELVAVAGLVGEALFEAGFEFVAPAGELVVVLLQAGLRVRGRRGGGGGAGGGGRLGHARGERSRVMGCGFRPASAEAENIFSRVGAGRWQAENGQQSPVRLTGLRGGEEVGAAVEVEGRPKLGGTEAAGATGDELAFHGGHGEVAGHGVGDVQAVEALVE